MKVHVKSKWLLLAALAVSITSVQAQKEYRLSVQEAVALSLKNTVDIKNLRIDSLKQKAQNQEVTGAALPQITGSAQVAHYLTLPKILFPSNGETSIYDVLNREGVKDGNGNTIPQKQSFTVQEFSFVQPWNVTAGVSLNQLLFQPEVFVGLMARNTLLEFAGNNIKVAEDKTREQVYKAYYQVLIAQQQLDVLQKTIQRLQKLLSDQGQLYKNGFIEKLDIDKTTVSLNNIKSTETQLKNIIELGFAALKFTTGLNQADTLVLTDQLNETLIKENVLDDGTVNYNNRNEMNLLKTAQKLGALDVKRYKLGYIPTLALFYQFQQQGQLNKNYSAFTGSNWFWFNSNLIGLNLSVPIFDGFQRKYKIKQAQYSLEKTNNSIEQFKQAVDLEHTVSKNNLKNAILNMDAQKENLELAERVYNTTKKKYEQGLGSTFEVLQADTEWQRAQGNYFDALYNAVIAKINYNKAVGTLK
jgi:outer membrane protein TolC